MSIIWRSKNKVVTKQISDFTPIWSSLKNLFMIFLVSQQQQAPKTQKWHPQVSFSWGWKNYVLEKMGTFPTLVKYYGKTVESPVSDRGGLFVKEVRTHIFFEENVLFHFVEEKLRYVYCSSMLSLKCLRMHWQANKARSHHALTGG